MVIRTHPLGSAAHWEEHVNVIPAAVALVTFRDRMTLTLADMLPLMGSRPDGVYIGSTAMTAEAREAMATQDATPRPVVRL